jgi:hypothetical protein
MKKMVSIVFCMLLLSVIPTGITAKAENNSSISTQISIMSDDLLQAKTIFDPMRLGRDRPGPGYYDTSEYFAGEISLAILMLESVGGADPDLETWNNTERAAVQSEMNQTITWWAAQNPYANISFNLVVYTYLPTVYEPIIHPSPFTDPTWEQIWVSDAMAQLGFYQGDWMERTRDWEDYLRLAYGTDWVYTVFVIDSSNDSDGCFSDGYCAYSYLGGPFCVVTYDNDGWGINAMDQVFAHETGHIFWATDEYNGVTEYSGYLNAADVEGSGCLMDTDALTLSSGTMLQVGWRDSDGDTIPDVLDTIPETFLYSYPEDPSTNTTLRYFGVSRDIALPNQNPSPWDPGDNITINSIASVLYRVDGGSYLPANPTDGNWSEWSEGYTFTTAALSPGTHFIEAVATNSVNNMDPTPGNDTVTIGTVSCTITGGIGVHLQVTNNGSTEAEDIPWQLHVTGGILGLLNKTMNGTIDVPAGSTMTVGTGLFFGLGPTMVTAKVADQEYTATGFQLIIFSLLN